MSKGTWPTVDAQRERMLWSWPMFKHIVKVAPTDSELDAIEQVVIVDEVPEATALGAGLASAIMVAETEFGLFTPQRINGTSDYATKYGGLGWTTEEGKHRGAVARRSGGTKVWNGSAHMARKGKRFGGLVMQRVDNSAGSVQFRRLAAIKGGKGPFNIEPGESITFQKNGAVNVSKTFAAVAARILGVGGTYPTNFVGGEDLLIQIDDDDPLPIIFTAAEQALADVWAYINAKAAATIASAQGGQLAIDSVVRGTAGRVRILGGSAAATLGLATIAVPDVWTWTMVNAQVGSYTIRATRYVSGVLNTYNATYASLDAVEANLAAGLLAAFQALSVPGATFTSPVATTVRLTADANVMFTGTVATEVSGGDITVVHTTTGKPVDQSGTGDVPNIDYIEAPDAGTVFGALTGLDAYVDNDGWLWVVNSGTSATGKLQATAGVFEAFGFDGELSDAADGDVVVLPPGVRVKDNTTGELWVTMEEVETTNLGGPFTMKVRPWEDTDTTVPSAIAGVNEVIDQMPGFWEVTNAAAITRLSAAQLDARYKDAIDKTLDVSSDAALCSMIFAARHSVNIGNWLRDNANQASENGCNGRTAIFSPPVGTTKAVAVGATGLGVGNIGRDDRLIYCFPGVRVLSEEILEVGTAGGIGFTADGLIEQTFDSWYAFIRTKIRQERSAGEIPSTTNVGKLNISSLEAAFESSLGGNGLVEDDYKTFKANGIVAPNRTIAGYTIQSDVTSVLRSIDKARAPANRRFMSDYIADELYNISFLYKDKLAFPGTIRALRQRCLGFLRGLQNPANPRILLSSCDLDSTPAQLDAGFVILYPKAKLAPPIQAILFKLQVGSEGVTIDEING